MKHMNSINRDRYYEIVRFLDYKQTDIADMLGISPQALSRALKLGRIDPYQFKRLARYLRINAAYLSGDMPNEQAALYLSSFKALHQISNVLQFDCDIDYLSNVHASLQNIG